MEEKYPVIIEGELKGVLTVRKEGAFTVFEAQCPMMEGVQRLSVYGDDGEGLLGVMMPEGDKLILRKKLSPNAMRTFPNPIIEAGLSGRGQAQPEQEKVPEEILEKSEEAAEEYEEAVETMERQENGKKEAEEADFTWYASPDGALVSFDGANSLLALPVGDERIPPMPQGERRSIEGKEYLVYITKNLRISD